MMNYNNVLLLIENIAVTKAEHIQRQNSCTPTEMAIRQFREFLHIPDGD